MKDVWKVVAGVGTLIALFLIATNADKLEPLIRTLAAAGNTTIVALQGRPVKGVTY